MTLDKNQKWESIVAPSIGEKVYLKYFDGIHYKLEVEILSKNDNLFSGKVLYVFEEDVGQINGSEIFNDLQSEPIDFDRTHVFL